MLQHKHVPVTTGASASSRASTRVFTFGNRGDSTGNKQRCVNFHRRCVGKAQLRYRSLTPGGVKEVDADMSRSAP